MKYSVVVVSVVLFIFSGGLVAAWAQPTPLGAPQVTPSVIVAGVPTTVRVEMSVADLGAIRGSVNLQRLDGSGKVVAILGKLRDDGLSGDAVAGDKIFTAVVTVNEPEPTRISLQASAALQGIMRRVTSGVVHIDVVPP